MTTFFKSSEIISNLIDATHVSNTVYDVGLQLHKQILGSIVSTIPGVKVSDNIYYVETKDYIVVDELIEGQVHFSDLEKWVDLNKTRTGYLSAYYSNNIYFFAVIQPFAEKHSAENYAINTGQVFYHQGNKSLILI